MVGTCECGNEPSGSMKCGEFEYGVSKVTFVTSLSAEYCTLFRVQGCRMHAEELHKRSKRSKCKGHFTANPYVLYCIVLYSILFYPVKYSVTEVRLSYLQTVLNKVHTIINFMVTLCINNIQHFNFQLMHTTLKNVELLKHFKISKTAPTCFGLPGNHHQGATVST